MGLPVEVNPLFLENQYPIQRSLRFRSSASAYLRLANGTPTSAQKWTWSAWVKRGTLGAQVNISGAGQSSGTNYAAILFNSNGTFQYNEDTTSNNLLVVTTQVFRDPSSWYHIVLTVDTTSATTTITGGSTDRIRLYINGLQVSSFSSTAVPAQNYNTYFNSSSYTKAIGNIWYNNAPGGFYFDGYLAEVNFIDGQPLAPTSFGQYNEFGVWSPRKYGGSYGTNGFYLPFNDPTSATTLCYDRQLGYTDTSKNNWTPNNISVTAGTTYDAMTDVPPPSTIQNVAAGNYATGNPIVANTATSWSVATMQAANLNWGDAATNANKVGVATIPMPNGYGKWYWEITIGSNFPASNTFIGITKSNASNLSKSIGIYYRNDGQKVIDGTASAYGSSYTAGNIIGLAYDATTGTLTCYKNNDTQGVLYSSGSGFDWLATITCDNAGVGVTYFNSVNFGQRPFSYTPPSGFLPLNSNNLPMPTIPNGAKVMAATKYDGTSSSNNVSNATNNTLGTTFQPDFVWIKNRNYASGTNHVLIDSIRGASLGLASNLTNADFSTTGNFSSINNNGFTVAGTTRDYNFLNDTFVGWQWNAGSGTTSSGTGTGGITNVTQSVNVSAGFSIVTYTGSGTAGATVTHGLGVTPSFIVIKNRSVSASWLTYHSSIGNTGAVFLNLPNATITSVTYFNNTSPNSTVFSVGDATSGNGSTNNLVAYCWTPIAGYSAFGSYTGNGSTDGPFVYTGFRPRWIMIKSSTTTTAWLVYDTSRNTYNVTDLNLRPNTSDAESSQTANYLDVLSNGFKLRGDSSGSINAAQTYIYACFAENPFKLALAR